MVALSTRIGRLALALSPVLASLLVAGCAGSSGSPTSPSSSSPTTFLSLTSAPGDLIGNGFTQRVGLQEAIFSALVSRMTNNTRETVNISVQPPSGAPRGWNWNLLLSMPQGESLRNGTFEGVRRWPGDNGQAGMDFFGSGAGCSFLTGRFVISDLSLGTDRTPNRMHITFEQRCDGATASIRGEISIVANPWR